MLFYNRSFIGLQVSVEKEDTKLDDASKHL